MFNFTNLQTLANQTTNLTRWREGITEASQAFTGAWSSLSSNINQIGTIIESSITDFKESMENTEIVETPVELPPLSLSYIPPTDGSCPILTLPNDSFKLIISMLDAQTVVFKLSFVCKMWYQVTNSDEYWKSRYIDESKSWESVVSLKKNVSVWEASLGRILPKEAMMDIEQPFTWKHAFMHRVTWNTEEYKNNVKLRTNPVSNEDCNLKPKRRTIYSPFDRPLKVVILGEGLETSAKRLVYEMMWGKNTPFKMTQLYPGYAGIGSGVGFEVNGANLNLCAFYNHTAILDKLVVENDIFFRETDGIIFIMDSYAETSETKKEIEQVLNSFNNKVPLLVLSCKHSGKENIENIEEKDLEEEKFRNEIILDSKILTPVQFVEKLELEDLENRHWCVRQVWVDTLDGVYQGLDWMLSVIN